MTPPVLFSLLAFAASACAQADRPRTLAGLGVQFSASDGADGATRTAAEDRLRASEPDVVRVIQTMRRAQQYPVGQIHWDFAAKRSRLICTKKQARCVLSLRPEDVIKAADVGELLEDLPLTRP